jgi:hypothetical protein
MENTRVPRALCRRDIDKHFSVNGHLIREMWCMSKEIDVQADNEKWYHAKYIAPTRSREEYVLLKRIVK